MIQYNQDKGKDLIKMKVETYIGITTEEIDEAVAQLVKYGCGVDEAIEEIFSVCMDDFEADLNDYLENFLKKTVDKKENK